MLLKAKLHTGREVCFGLKSPTPKHLFAKARYMGHLLGTLPAPPANLSNGFAAKYRSMYGNDQKGDCEVAEQCRHKAVIKNIVIPTANALKWYFAHTGNRDTGMNTTDCLTAAQKDPLIDDKGVGHLFGPFGTVDWTNKLEVMQSIRYFKTIKLEVAASQLLKAVGNSDGWTLIGARRDQASDHCVQIADYGTYQFFCTKYKVAMKPGISPTTFGVGLYTWATVGFLDFQSYLNITSGGFVRITDPDRLDKISWDAIANTDYKDITGGSPSPAPAPNPTPTPGPRPTHRATILRHNYERLHEIDPKFVMGQLAHAEKCVARRMKMHGIDPGVRY